MNSKTKIALLVAAVGLLMAGSTGAAVWWALKPAGSKAEAKGETTADPVKPGPEYRYVSLDKVLIMLRNNQGEAVTHYMAIDLVFKALPEQEKRTKDHLPMLRTVAVKALSSYTVDMATAMTVEKFGEELNRAYTEAYAAEGRQPPFAEALIGKLIIE